MSSNLKEEPRGAVSHVALGAYLNPLQVYSKPELFRLLGISPATGKRLDQAGDLPAKTQLSPGRIGFTGRAIAAWQDARTQQKGAA